MRVFFSVLSLFGILACSAVDPVGDKGGPEGTQDRPVVPGLGGGHDDDTPGGGIDTIPPVISLIGDSQVSLEPCIAFEDPGALAIDSLGGELEVQAIYPTDFFEVLQYVEGTYEVRYEATDAAGNSAIPVIRTLEVSETSLFSAEDFSRLRENLSGDFRICQDVSFSANSDFEPIGSASTGGHFLGRLSGRKANGERAKISGLRLERGGNNLGLFASLGDSAVVQEIDFESVEVLGNQASSSWVGILAGRSSGLIQGVSVKNARLEGRASVGGIVGWLFASSSGGPGRIENVFVENLSIELGALDAGGRYAGGIVGFMSNNTQLKNVRVGNEEDLSPYPVKISGSDRAILGGIAGGVSSGQIESCEFYGDLSMSWARVSGDSSLGGVVGVLNSAEALDCHSFGDLHAPSNSMGGGVAGWMIGSSAAIKESSSSLLISGLRELGGLAGRMGEANNNHQPSIERSFFDGVITGQESLGGIVGLCYNCLISKSIADIIINSSSGSRRRIGGIIGWHIGGLTTSRIDDSLAMGLINGALTASGGLIGEAGRIRLENSYALVAMSLCPNQSSCNQSNSTLRGLVGRPTGSGSSGTRLENSFWDRRLFPSEPLNSDPKLYGQSLSSQELRQIGPHFINWAIGTIWLIPRVGFAPAYPRLKDMPELSLPAMDLAADNASN
ncbi:MAG: DUF5011 domain-containing protein [Bradymonadales bacterium]|nr:MAG: DUF5011 domain-containing protein [Bradymonadales bacterium]